jgi:hypothetical protein
MGCEGSKETVSSRKIGAGSDIGAVAEVWLMVVVAIGYVSSSSSSSNPISTPLAARFPNKENPAVQKSGVS